MKKLGIILLAVIVLTGCGNHKNKPRTVAEAEMVELEKSAALADSARMAVAFGEQREISDEEMQMFRNAMAADSQMVYTPLSVSTQVVAGTNYRFWCRYEDISDGIRNKAADATDKYGYCWIKIFKPLPGRGEPQVTSIDKDGALK